MIHLGIDNNTKEYALLNWTGSVKELTDAYPDIIWYSSFNNMDEVNKFLEWYENNNIIK